MVLYEQTRRDKDYLMLNTHANRLIPLAPSPISAGSGLEPLDSGHDLLDLNRLATNGSPRCRAYVVSGDSAAPRIHAGDLIIVDPDVEPQHGDVIAVARNGLNCIKILEKRPRLRLVSANDAYGELPVDDDDDLYCLGVVRAYFGRPRPHIPVEPKIVVEYKEITETAAGLYHVEMVTETGEKVELYFPKKEVINAIKMATSVLKEKVKKALGRGNEKMGAADGRCVVGRFGQ